VKFLYPIRSKLFVPGSRPELFSKAFGTAADALSFDLEDAVVPGKKHEARSAVASFLRGHEAGSEKITIVRVNGLSSGFFLEDVALLAGAGLDLINLPKVESRDDILRAVDAIGEAERSSGVDGPIGILANIETPKGLRLALEIATADPRVIGLQLGFTDLSFACGMASQNKIALNAARLAVRFAAAEAGIVSYDGAFVDVKDGEAFRAEAEEARDLGFSGKSCIHPSQIPTANAVFSPSTEEIDHAERLLRAAEEADERGVGAFLHEGKMVDIPIVARARAVKALAAKLGVLEK
jgi:citrate lyase subunit beta / citryl-CoA lyase